MLVTHRQHADFCPCNNRWLSRWNQKSAKDQSMYIRRRIYPQRGVEHCSLRDGLVESSLLCIDCGLVHHLVSQRSKSRWLRCTTQTSKLWGGFCLISPLKAVVPKEGEINMNLQGGEKARSSRLLTRCEYQTLKVKAKPAVIGRLRYPCSPLPTVELI